MNKVDKNTPEYWDSTYKGEGSADPNGRDDRHTWKLIASSLQDGEFSLLDVGCGSGYLLRYLEQALPQVELHGTDLSVAGIEIAQSRTKAALSVGNALVLPYTDNTFDYVVSSEFLEHITDIDQVLTEIERVLKPGGKTIHVFPYKDFVPSDEHVREYDEDSAEELFIRHFAHVWVRVETSPHLVWVKPNGERVPSKLLVAIAFKEK